MEAYLVDPTPSGASCATRSRVWMCPCLSHSLPVSPTRRCVASRRRYSPERSQVAGIVLLCASRHRRARMFWRRSACRYLHFKFKKSGEAPSPARPSRARHPTTRRSISFGRSRAVLMAPVSEPGPSSRHADLRYERSTSDPVSTHPVHLGLPTEPRSHTTSQRPGSTRRSSSSRPRSTTHYTPDTSTPKSSSNPGSSTARGRSAADIPNSTPTSATPSPRCDGPSRPATSSAWSSPSRTTTRRPPPHPTARWNGSRSISSYTATTRVVSLHGMKSICAPERSPRALAK